MNLLKSGAFLLAVFTNAQKNSTNGKNGGRSKSLSVSTMAARPSLMSFARDLPLAFV